MTEQGPPTGSRVAAPLPGSAGSSLSKGSDLLAALPQLMAGCQDAIDDVGGTMSTVLNPYINFRGTAREAMEFYRSVFGGELQISTFAEYHAGQDPSEDQLVMHSRLITTAGYVLMGSDAPERQPLTVGNNVSMSLGGEERDELQGYWDRLSDGATILVPLAPSPWGDSFGMLTDRFGVNWLVNIAASPAGSP
jgi:PhnB protein